MSAPTTPDFLNNIPNSEIEDYALLNLARIKKDLLADFGKNYDINESQSITNIIRTLTRKSLNILTGEHAELNYLVYADLLIENDT